MSERTHWVYRAYDDEGLLLYIGCTANPTKRYRQHMSGNSDARGWFESFVSHWRVSGPYVRDVAFAKEKAEIEQSQPIWNGHSHRNRHEDRALIRDYLSSRNARFVEGPRANRPLLVIAQRRRRSA